MKPNILLKIEKTREYLDYIERHYDNVQKAHKFIVDVCANDLRWHLDPCLLSYVAMAVFEHDISKLSHEEFIPYRESFFSIDDEEKEKSSMQEAWKHHKKANDHHWQNWTNLDDEERVVRHVAFIHMVIDWQAMTYEFGGSIQSYYEGNKDKIKLPNWAERDLHLIFKCISNYSLS